MTKCQQFKSKDEEVDLIPVEEFYALAPEEISKREATAADEHAQRLARLEFENEQRKDMNAAFLKLEEAKEGLERFIREGQTELESVVKGLENWWYFLRFSLGREWRKNTTDSPNLEP